MKMKDGLSLVVVAVVVGVRVGGWRGSVCACRTEGAG